VKRAGGSRRQAALDRQAGRARATEWIRGKWGREEVEWAAEGEEGREGQNR
jgi:hypothetical protein